MLRTHTCGELNDSHVGKTVTLYGWVDTVRDHGGVYFLDLRDRYGKTQLVAGGKDGSIQHAFKSEDCVQIQGTVQKRPAGTENNHIPTGKIEILVTKLLEVNASQPLPFEVTKSRETNEELRLKYRYLDLRNPEVQRGLFARHRIYQIIRTTLDKHGFIEVETPILTKSTPEGARDYLVPSRVNPGEFYALPQSPQLFKQILMVSGFDRYFQIAKCFRDEDLRADRQPEFTQLDMEMSFLDEDALFGIVEETLVAILKEVPGVELKRPFIRLTYQEAMAKYGTDKPDLRFGIEIKDVSSVVKNSGFGVFDGVLAKPGGVVLGVCVPAANASRKDFNDWTEFAKSEGAGGLLPYWVKEGNLDGPGAKHLKPEIHKKLIEVLGAKQPIGTEDVLLFIADDQLKKAQKILGSLRLRVARDLRDKGHQNFKDFGKQFHFSWVTDFPLFQYDEEEKRWASEHHPFTRPNDKDWAEYKKIGEPACRQAGLGKIRSRAYDLVLNGNEIASGSIRIHNRDLQNEIFETIGLNPEEIQSRFGFLLGAFQYGTPPHGGVALGIDRVVAILLGLESIREVIAFPKNQKAVDPMTDAPSPATEKQLRELHVRLR